MDRKSKLVNILGGDTEAPMRLQREIRRASDTRDSVAVLGCVTAVALVALASFTIFGWFYF